MRFFKDSKIGVRLILVLSMVMIITIVGLGVFTLNSQKKKILEDTDIRMSEQVDDLSVVVKNEIESSQSQVNLIINMAEEIMKSKGTLTESAAETVEFNAINQETGESSTVNVKAWYINGVKQQGNTELVDYIQKQSTGAVVSIFQKIPQGYIRIATNVVNKDGQRTTGSFISGNSPVAQAINSGNPFYGRAMVMNEWHLAAYKPIWINGKVEGIISVGHPEMDLPAVKALFKSKKYFASGYPFMITNKGLMVIHPEKEGQNLYDSEFFQQLHDAKTETGKTFYAFEGRQKYQYFRYIPAIESFVSVSIYETELMEIIKKVRIALIIAILIGCSFFLVITNLITRSISKALNKGVNMAKKIAEGDLDVSIDINQKDEIGQLAEALNSMASKLKEIVSNIVNGASSISSASLQVSSTSQQLSQGASEQASSVEEVSSTMEEMASNIQQNTDNAVQTEKISLIAQEGIEDVFNRSSKSIEATRIIAEKIKIINDIAFQTNILALNAAVEAARAGEHGRGFAVVAAEVRKLAERSKFAADEIVDLAGKGLQLAEGAGKRLAEMVPEVKRTTQLVQEISAASVEQNNGSTQINTALQQMNDVTQQNAAASEELATSAEELSSQAETLKEMVSYFRIGIEYSKKRNVATQRRKEIHTEPIPQGIKHMSVKPVIKKAEKISDSEFENF